jgi:hypothetical protein
LTIDFLKQTTIKRIIDLPLLKNPYPLRKIGFELFLAIANAKGEEGFKAEPSILKLILGMCSDMNWKLRK